MPATCYWHESYQAVPVLPIHAAADATLLAHAACSSPLCGTPAHTQPATQHTSRSRPAETLPSRPAGSAHRLWLASFRHLDWQPRLTALARVWWRCIAPPPLLPRSWLSLCTARVESAGLSDRQPCVRWCEWRRHRYCHVRGSHLAQRASIRRLAASLIGSLGSMASAGAHWRGSYCHLYCSARGSDRAQRKWGPLARRQLVPWPRLTVFGSCAVVCVALPPLLPPRGSHFAQRASNLLACGQLEWQPRLVAFGSLHSILGGFRYPRSCQCQACWHESF